jgi:hypothetical protein
MKTRLTLSLLVAALSACSSTATTMSGSTAANSASPLDGARIDIVQEGGFAGLAIRNTVTHDDRSYISSKRSICASKCGAPMDSASGMLSAGATDSLFAAVLAQKPFALKDDYGVTKNGADMFAYTVRITADGKSKSIRFDDGTMPEPMQKTLLAVQTAIFGARR